MKSSTIRQQFLDFFADKQHKIVPSAPMVIKDDPTLMFTNAGMNPFKEFFLGDKVATDKRVADTQKCLRVSGKHNDLEEVGLDSYHHTMFEMLGNWSFGDYFKAEAIAWAWELLTGVYKLDKDRLYVTVFEGDKADGTSYDEEATKIWEQFISTDRILQADKKDNFWEMGDTGPCGPCSEIHIDLRDDADRAKESGASLVNKDHPLVIEIWNLVFIQYQRKADGSLEALPDKHIDTGMGFERLCMAIQGVKSNYDTDIFTPFISKIETMTGVKYKGSYAEDAKSDIAMRVIADHLRAVSFTIADGELPSNTGAGYVIRRILRRAVRYYYSFMDRKEPLVHELVPMLADQFGDTFPELRAQVDFIKKVILEEEKSFLRTLAGGLKRIDDITVTDGVMDGQTAFELYDTYGFPIDLTRLIGEEKGWTVDEPGFEVALAAQKARGKADAKREAGDWHIVSDVDQVDFVGYDDLSTQDSKVVKHRTIKQKDKSLYQIVLDKTPFYPEGGGQVGDKGHLTIGGETIKVLDTVKENNLPIHIVDKLPADLSATVAAHVDAEKRHLTENNHSATHLLHAALQQVLGDHVQQKGSLVKEDYLRFDFAHFEKMTVEQITEVEQIVNQRIRQNIALQEDRSISIAQAKEAGAMMLFGEKYGDTVRMITFDPTYSRELCGGCHVSATGEIGLFKIVSESAIAAGVRRVEAVTASAAESYVRQEIDQLTDVRAAFKNPQDLLKSVKDLQEENRRLSKELDALKVKQAGNLQGDLIAAAVDISGAKVIKHHSTTLDAKTAKTLVFNITKQMDNAVVLLALDMNGKPQLQLGMSEAIVNDKGWHAGNMVRTLAQHIKGGGGGQPFFASAGGKDTSGLQAALDALEGQLV